MKRILFLPMGLAIVLSGSLMAATLGASAHGALVASPLVLGPAKMATESTYQGYYDSHKDTYLLTDTSNKAQASTWHINFAPVLAKIHGQPAQYFVQGKAAAGQIAVFGSEPPAADYSPLWAEIVVKWKAGAKVVLLKSDNQILALAKSGKLTDKPNGIILNAPITKVGK
jgi:hypothetical protein